MSVQLRLKSKTLISNPSFTKLLSSSSSSNKPKTTPFLDIKSHLKQQHLPPPASTPVKFTDLYKKNVLDTQKNEPNSGGAGGFSFDKMQENLAAMRANNINLNANANANSNMTNNSQGGLGFKRSNGGDLFNRNNQGGGFFSKRKGGAYSIDVFKKNLDTYVKEGPMKKEVVEVKGGVTLPLMLEREEKEGESEESKIRLVRTYDYEELGERLKLLAEMEKKGKGEEKKSGFSIAEMGERLKKLKEVEKMGMQPSILDLRESLSKLKDTKTKTSPKANISNTLLGLERSEIMLGPAKEDLVEKYFHPDNMSSQEKLKLELKRVGDEFKMSESDCGSSQFQVAQLTTKIKHLSSVLHKKDKHSRKGLMQMIQQRKKLLKHLRRTNWDSYVLVLDKLGLRDNPDYLVKVNNPNYKKNMKT